MSEKQIYPSDAADKVLVRMPDGLRDRLKEAAKPNNRTMNAEIVLRLQDSFEPRSDQEWQLKVALHINQARLDTLREHIALLDSYRNQLQKELQQAGGNAPAALMAELHSADNEMQNLRDRMRGVIAESADLERKKAEANRDVNELLDRLADGAIQEELRALHALEERLGIPKESRGAIASPPPERGPILPTQMAGLSAYEKLLNDALAKRDEKLRAWWEREFGYDPEAPKVSKPASKGPARSPNSKKPRP